MALPLTSDSFARARQHETLAQDLVARAYRGERLVDLAKAHVNALAELSDLGMAWWLQRTWFMVGRRDIKALQQPRNPGLASLALAETFCHAFNQGPELTSMRAQIIQVVTSQALPFLALDNEDNGLAPQTHLARLEWALATADTAEVKNQILSQWSDAVQTMNTALIGLAIQRLLDPDQFWREGTIARKSPAVMFPWVDAPDWPLEAMRSHLEACLPSALWATVLPLVEASFPKLPNLRALGQSLGVPLMTADQG